MRIEIPYGNGRLPLEAPEHAVVIEPPECREGVPLTDLLAGALENPINAQPLHRLARRGQSALIIINDNTRPAPNREMLEALLPELARAGIRESAVKVLVANGNHRPNTREEIREMVGPDLAARLHIVNHDCEDTDRLVFKGTTAGGLPVWVNKLLDEVDLVVLTGLIAPHQSAGFSGGRKSLVPGVAGLETIVKHHSFPIRSYHPVIGVLDGNPFHTEAVNAARLVAPDFILNVVQNVGGQVDFAVAGEFEAAHLAGVEKCRSSWNVALHRRFDIIVVSPGGYPRDIDLHQSQKAVSTAELAAAPEAIIILAAECRSGIGKFASWLKEAGSPDEVIERFSREGFIAKDHSSKAFMWARAFRSHKVFLYSPDLDPHELRTMFFYPAAHLQEAVDEALREKGPLAGMLVIPEAVHCIPRVCPSMPG